MTRPAVAFGAVFGVVLACQVRGLLTSADKQIRQQKILPLTGEQL